MSDHDWDEWDRWTLVRDACVAWGADAIEALDVIRGDAIRDRTELDALRRLHGRERER